SVGDDPEVNPPCVERRQRLCKPCTRHHRLWKARIPMHTQARDLGNGAPWKSLREIPQDLCTRMIAPHIGRQQGDGNRGDRGGRQVVRKIALKTLCIVHDGFGAIRQRVVEIEENRLQHNMFLHYGYQLSNLTVMPSGSTKVEKSIYS